LPAASASSAKPAIEFGRLAADRRRDRWDRREPVLQCPQIEPGAADNDRQSAGGVGGGDLGQRQPPPQTDRATLGGVDKTVEPMRHAGDCRRVGPGAEYAQIAVDLQTVGVDDRTVE